jgi:hypothetical protein
MTTPHARPIRPFNDAPETQAEADVAYASHARPDAFRRIETRNGPLFEDSTTGRVLTADEMEPEPMTQWVSAPGTCWRFDPGPDHESPTCLSCGRAIIKTVRPSGATWWGHEGPTIGEKLAALNNRRRTGKNR